MLDDQELSRVTGIDEGYETPLVVIVQFPMKTKNSLGNEQYDTYPLAIVLTNNVVITASHYKPKFIHDYIHNPLELGIKTTTQETFALKLLWYLSHRYNEDLDSILSKSRLIESTLGSATNNSQVYELMGYQQSMINFDSALKDNQPIYDALQNSENYFKSVEHDRLLGRIVRETVQASTTASVGSEVITEYANLASTIVNNSLNHSVRILTGIQILFGIFGVMGSVFGINPIPGTNFGMGVYLIWGITTMFSVMVGFVLHKHDYL